LALSFLSDSTFAVFLVACAHATVQAFWASALPRLFAVIEKESPVIIGVPKEIKTREYRVGMTPAGVKSLTARGHKVLVEKSAGEGAGIKDADYIAVGGQMVNTASEAWGAEMVVKVKEPLPAEFGFFRENQIIYTYLHLAPELELTKALAQKKVAAVAYETIENPDGTLPLLRPMSEVAGRMAVQVGATCLEKEHGGKGLLLGGVPGTRRGRVVILGGGVVGRNAATIAVGMGAQVTILDVRAETMAYLEDIFGGAVETLYSNPINIEAAVRRADMVVGGVLVTGARAPKLVTKEMIGTMEPGSVVVDVAVDQGGCIETCRPTTLPICQALYLRRVPGRLPTQRWPMRSRLQSTALWLQRRQIPVCSKASTSTVAKLPTSPLRKRTRWSTCRHCAPLAEVSATLC
jgi:alanine dehydrogenase